jgi:hypothetical protein
MIMRSSSPKPSTLRIDNRRHPGVPIPEQISEAE